MRVHRLETEVKRLVLAKTSQRLRLQRAGAVHRIQSGRLFRWIVAGLQRTALSRRRKTAVATGAGGGGLLLRRKQRLVDGHVCLDADASDGGMLLLDVTQTVGLRRKSDRTLAARERLVRAARLRAKMMLQRAVELEVLSAVLAHRVGGLGLRIAADVSGGSVLRRSTESNRAFYLLLRFQTVLLPVDRKIEILTIFP